MELTVKTQEGYVFHEIKKNILGQNILWNKFIIAICFCITLDNDQFL